MFGSGARNEFNRPRTLEHKFTFSFQDASGNFPNNFQEMEEIETARLKKTTQGSIQIISNLIGTDTTNMCPLYG